ncbi:hypothetical protein LPJ53_001144 [Coemansia erecta]|uniref:ABC transporter domain-containing protein n=1 Tax=Coemansia erecta TaxID=147472 RepID=A0A9W7Y5L1_9FUNG|nr:hypothetical protein LPJ53_001144 [Coemansia erecta]
MSSSSPLQITFSQLTHSVKVPMQTGEEKDERSAWSRLKQRVFRKKTYGERQILRNLDGTFLPGRLTGILGPSGSGKTTLLNLLAGQISTGSTGGDIWVNGRPTTGAGLRRLAGYVNQEDVILSTQTVQEAIEMSITLRPPPQAAEIEADDGLPLPAAMEAHAAKPAAERRAEMRERSDQALALFGLGKCRDTMVGDAGAKGVSGGEKKRTAIAMEWVSEARVLFLDEPTSGLDAHSALLATRQLRQVAQTGRTVVAVLHQPSSEMFALLDDVLVLLDGRIVYLGPREQLVGYLARLGRPCGMYVNPADHLFNSVLFAEAAADGAADGAQAQARADELVAAWAASPEAAELRRRVDTPELAPVGRAQFRRTAPALRQLRYLLTRETRNALRNPLVLSIRLVQSCFFGLLIGLVFLNTQNRSVDVQQQNFSGSLFFTSVAQFLVAILSVSSVFTAQRLVFQRERRAGYYGLPAYYAAKNIVELPIQVCVPVLYSCIAYWLLGLRRDAGRFFIFVATTVSLNLCGFACGMLLAASFDSLATILSLLPVVFMPFLLFGGLLVNTGNSTVWLRWIQWTSPIKYAYTALMKNQFVGYRVGGQDIGDAYLRRADLGSFSIAANIVLILVIALLAWAMAFVALARLASEGSKLHERSARQEELLLGPPDERFVSAQPQAEKQAPPRIEPPSLPESSDLV